VTFSPETPEFALSTITPFVAYHAKYLKISWTYRPIDLLYKFGRRISGDDYANSHLAVAQGTLPWQPIKFALLLWRSTIDWLVMKTLIKDSVSVIRLHHIQIWW